jgi:tol-pal system protein YbgF
MAAEPARALRHAVMPIGPGQGIGSRRRGFAAGISAALEALTNARGARGAAGLGRALRALAVVALAAPAGGCYAPQMMTFKSGLDSLRAVVDTMAVRDSVAYAEIVEIRREIASQRDLLLNTRASSGSTTSDVFDRMGRVEGKLDEVMGRFQQMAQKPAAPAAPAGPDPNQLYDEAAQDLTQGRYSMALRGFRDFIQRFPTGELSDNAQYGVGECFFAQSMFDSAATEYALVGDKYPDGDRVPAALYKLALSQEKLKQTAEAKKTLNDLIKRYPLSGEAQLARERLGASRKH